MKLQELEIKYQELGKEIERLKAEEKEKGIKYPIYCLLKSDSNNIIVKFDGLTSGIIVKNSIDNVGFYMTLPELACWFLEGVLQEFIDRSKNIKFMENTYRSNSWGKHTNINTWEQLKVCEKTGFYDGQLVWCWDEDDTHKRISAFYDVKNKCIFTSEGKRDGFKWDNYEPFEGNWPEWAQEAFKTLER